VINLNKHIENLYKGKNIVEGEADDLIILIRRDTNEVTFQTGFGELDHSKKVCQNMDEMIKEIKSIITAWELGVYFYGDYGCNPM